jgi:hypothetical protein
MSRIEYKLFRTKQANNFDANLQTTAISHFYILVEFVPNLYELNEQEIDSIWFNRQNGQITAKKSIFYFLNKNFSKFILFTTCFVNIKVNSVKEFDEIGKVYGYIGKFQINSSKQIFFCLFKKEL